MKDDAMVVDPAVAVSEMIEGVTRDGLSYTSYDEEPIDNGPTTADAIGLADLLPDEAKAAAIQLSESHQHQPRFGRFLRRSTPALATNGGSR